jgi:hypothetical protein
MKLLTGVGIALILSCLFAVTWTYELNPSDFSNNIFNPVVLLMVLATAILSITSFSLTRIHLKQIHTRVIAAVFLIVALSVPGIFYYANETSYVGCLCSGTNGPPMLISASIVVPTGSGNGTLSVQIRDDNSEGASITAVSFTNERLNNVTTIPNINSLELTYQGRPVSATNPLPIGATAAGSLDVSNIAGGIIYNIGIEGTFQNGGYSFQEYSLTAQF